MRPSAAFDTFLRHFRRPRPSCAGCDLAGKYPEGKAPAPPAISERICGEHLPGEHPLPEFFRLRAEAAGRSPVGAEELREAYDRVHADYDEFWLREAGRPIKELVARLVLPPNARVFEAGCGTGYGTALLAAKAGAGAVYLAVDLSEGMLSVARGRLGGRLAAAGIPAVTLERGDALEPLRAGGPFDLVFTRPSSPPPQQRWPPREAGLRRPPRPLAARAPRALRGDRRRGSHGAAKDRRLRLPRRSRSRAAVFRYPDARGVLEHLLKSGAGTAYYDALDPVRRPALEAEFLRRLAARHPAGDIAVVHDYVSVIAQW